MADPNPPKADRIGADYKQGPNPGPGGELDPGDMVPPYDGRTRGRQDDVRGASTSVARSLPDEPVGGADQTASPATPTDPRTEQESDPVLGVDKSPSTPDEDVGGEARED